MSKGIEHGEGRFAAFTSAELAEIAYRIGDLLMRLPLVARDARHTYPTNTMLDYVDVSEDKIDRAAKEYLKDFLQRPHGMTTDELLLKWGGVRPSALADAKDRDAHRYGR
jgi:hypothetical protein